MRGTIRMMKREKGFGFIVEESEAGRKGTKPAGDFFFHRSSCAERDGYDRLQERDVVEFDVVSEEELDKRDRGKGPRAKNVRPVTYEM